MRNGSYCYFSYQAAVPCFIRGGLGLFWLLLSISINFQFKNFYNNNVQKLTHEAWRLLRRRAYLFFFLLHASQVTEAIAGSIIADKLLHQFKQWHVTPADGLLD